MGAVLHALHFAEELYQPCHTEMTAGDGLPKRLTTLHLVGSSGAVFVTSSVLRYRRYLEYVAPSSQKAFKTIETTKCHTCGESHVGRVVIYNDYHSEWNFACLHY